MQRNACGDVYTSIIGSITLNSCTVLASVGCVRAALPTHHSQATAQYYDGGYTSQWEKKKPCEQVCVLYAHGQKPHPSTVTAVYVGQACRFLHIGVPVTHT